MPSITAGLAGGLLATIVMTAVMMRLGDGGSPPTAALVEKFAGGEPNDHATPVMILHTVYGVDLGGFLGAGILG